MVKSLTRDGLPACGSTSQRPSQAPEGALYFDDDLGQLLVWDGQQGSGAWRPAVGVFAEQVTYTENGAGTYTGSVNVPAGASILDIIIDGIALWAAASSATMKVGDVAVDNGFFTGINLKATDLLAGESISFDQAGGKAGSYIANSQVSPRYSASARVISGIVTSVGAGTTGRTRMTVIYTLPRVKAAVQS